MKATSAMRVVRFFTTLLVLFSLHGASVTATQTCGGQITGTGSGRVMSPYHPQKYPKNASCVWTIVVDVGSGLRLEVEHLNNKELSNSGSTGQCYDTLDIYQVIPAGTERRITPSLCASSVAELTTNVFEVPAIGGSTVIRIRFKSDYAIQLSGFSISYKAMCNVTVQNSTGVLTSPGYPSLYPENIVCMTRIITPQDTTVHLSFEQFILEDSADCTSDSLTINTNQGSGIRSVGKKYCGNKNPGQIVATSNDVTITFISDGSFPKLGFIAKWSTGASDTPMTTEATTMDVSTTTDTLGALLPVTINAGEVQPKTNNGTQDKSFNRKDELNNNQWFIYVVVVFLLFAIIATVIVILILRRRKKRSEHPPVPGEVAFRQLEGDENGDPEWRPRENTYVEIPFLNQDLPLSVGFTPTPSLPGRQASSTSLDSVAEAKIKATEEDKVDEMNGGYSMDKDVPAVDQVQTAENPYTLANDEPEFMLNPLPENGLADNPYQQIDYAAMKSPKLPTSTTASKTKSTKKPWNRIFKKAQSEKSLGVAKPQLSQIKNRPPQPAPRNNIPHKEQDPAGIRNPTFQKSPQKDECSPELKPEESVKNNNPTAPGKSRQSMTSLISEDVFEDNTTYNHYQSPTDIHEKFPSLSISASCCNDTVTCAKEGDTSCYDCPTKCVLANAPVPHDSFKVCISPDIIDKQEETDSWYASPTSPKFELQQTSALYDVPKGSSSSDEKSRGNSNASTTTDDSYCSMVRTKPMKPKTKKHRPGAGNDTSVYTTMQPGAHFENKSYGMHK